MTTHELAKLLLSGEDMPIYHHYHYHEDFANCGQDWHSEVDVYVDKGKTYITTGQQVWIK